MKNLRILSFVEPFQYICCKTHTGISESIDVVIEICFAGQYAAQNLQEVGGGGGQANFSGHIFVYFEA